MGRGVFGSVGADAQGVFGCEERFRHIFGPSCRVSSSTKSDQLIGHCLHLGLSESPACSVAAPT